MENKDRRYYFPILLTGVGKTAEEAWDMALEGYMQDPGAMPDEYTSEPETPEGEPLLPGEADKMREVLNANADAMGPKPG